MRYIFENQQDSLILGKKDIVENTESCAWSSTKSNKKQFFFEQLLTETYTILGFCFQIKRNTHA